MSGVKRSPIQWLMLITMMAALAVVVPGAGTAAPVAAAQPVAAAAALPSPDKYSPNEGLRFNEPYGRNGRSASNIRRHILRSIDSTVRRDVIKMAAWNIRGRNYVDALIRAHRRGVAVQVVIDRSNWTREHPNPDAAKFARAVSGRENRPNQSFLVPCKSSCRGTRGIPHSKFFLFSHVQKRKWVAMFGSNNATDVAANDQWNDLYTFVDNQTIYNAFASVFWEMKQDRSVGARGFQRHTFNPNVTVDFYPYKGELASAMGDPDMGRLKQITCRGATGGAGINGRTSIRIAQTAIHGDRGIALAKQVIKLKKAGCNIRIIYALMGGEVHRLFKAARVPILQYAYDRDRNGVYDIYVHMKAMAVSGVYGGQTDARITFNGSANWSAVPLSSDEVVATFRRTGMTNAYTRWIDYLFTHRPGSWGSVNLAPGFGGEGVATRTTAGSEGAKGDGMDVTDDGVDAYSFMRESGL